MAGAKQDTRQKMINMMYLVFIAMLALNISKEVLATLGLINDDIAASTQDMISDSNEKYKLFSNNSTNEYPCLLFLPSFSCTPNVSSL